MMLHLLVAPEIRSRQLESSENIKAIYHVEMGNTKTAQMIQEATGVEILELHSCHTVTSKQLQEGVTYVELMRQNAENLKKGLQ